MKKHVIAQGKCIALIFFILFIGILFGIKEYFDAKEYHTNIHKRVDALERYHNAN